MIAVVQSMCSDAGGGNDWITFYSGSFTCSIHFVNCRAFFVAWFATCFCLLASRCQSIDAHSLILGSRAAAPMHARAPWLSYCGNAA